MEIIIKCPNCGHNLILSDEWGDSEYHNNEYLDYSTGYCEHCEKEFFITNFSICNSLQFVLHYYCFGGSLFRRHKNC